MSTNIHYIDTSHPRDDEEFEQYQDRLRAEQEPDNTTATELTDEQIDKIGAMHDVQVF